MSDLFAKAVLRQMAASRVGVGEVARRAGMHRNVLSRWMDGSGTIRLDQFVRISEVLGFEVRLVPFRTKPSR